MNKPNVASVPVEWHKVESTVDYGERDRLIVDWLDHNKLIERYIFAHIAGVTFPNLDGSSRQVALCRCKPMQLLVLKWERDNPVSQTAVAVHLETGEQLGYLQSRLGEETLKRINKGEIWSGFIVSIGVPAGSEREVLGATIVIVKLKKPQTPEKPWGNGVWTKTKSHGASSCFTLAEKLEPTPSPQIAAEQVPASKLPASKQVVTRTTAEWVVILCVLLPVVLTIMFLIFKKF